MLKIKINDKFNAINDAICYWMGYQFKIGRERLIHEASLRYPMADIITAQGTKITEIQLERVHPCFKDRLIDLFVFNRAVIDVTDNNLKDSTIEIYEFKIVKRETGRKCSSEHQRVINDILRLAYFNKETGKDAYFLICGKYQDFKNYFIGHKEDIKHNNEENIIIKERNSQTLEFPNTGWKTENSLYKDLFDFEISISPKEYIFTNSNTDCWGLKHFQDNYKIKNNIFSWDNSIKVQTTCVAITPFESITHRTHACGIWKIES